MVKRILVTSAGGPAAENVVENLRIPDEDIDIVGCDVDNYLLQLSSVNKKFLVHSAYDVDNYIRDLNKIINKEKITMVYPQSDIEVLVCAINREVIKAPICLPDTRVIQLCQDKGQLYTYLKEKGIAVPEFKLPTANDIRMLCLSESPNYGIGVWLEDVGKPTEHTRLWDDFYPCWIRARKGAGGNKAYVANNWHEFRAMTEFYKSKGEYVEWMLIKYLKGDDLSWTSIWKDGELLTSVLKKRIKWVYNRIGTTAVQETIVNQQVNEYCESIVKALDPKLTGIMMIDLKQDTDDKKFYITEINSGRLGTVNLFFGYASRQIYHDDRVNFAYILTKICHNEPLPKDMLRFNALPEHLFWLRHIDMGYKLSYKAKPQDLYTP